MCAVHDGRCSPWVMCSVVSGNRIHDTGDGAEGLKSRVRKKEKTLFFATKHKIT